MERVEGGINDYIANRTSFTKPYYFNPLYFVSSFKNS